MSMNLEKLREEIAELVARAQTGDLDSDMAADRILENPTIKTALRFTDLHRQAGNVVGDAKL